MHQIEAIALYEVVSARSSVIAPDANYGVRPAESRETLLVLQTGSGLTGICSWPDAGEPSTADFSWMVGLDPRELLSFHGGYVRGLSSAYRDRMRLIPAVDGAVLDLAGQIENVPIWKLLGPEARDEVPVINSTVFFEDLLEEGGSVCSVADRAKEAVERGHRAILLRVGRGLKWMPWPECTQRDVEACLAVRDAVGEDVRLMASGGQGYSGAIGDAADFLAETSECRFEWVEDLVSEAELGALRSEIDARGLSVPLAAGQFATTAEWCQNVAAPANIGVYRMDFSATGYLEYLRIGDFARDHGAKVAPHTFGTCVGLFQSLQLGKALPSYMTAECDDSVFSSYAAPGYVFREGAYSVSDLPGLGLEIEALGKSG